MGGGLVSIVRILSCNYPDSFPPVLMHLTFFGGSPIPLYLYMWTDVYSPSYSPPSLCVNYSSISCSLSISRWVCLRLFFCIIRSVIPVLRTLVLNCTVLLALNCTSFYWSWHWTAHHFTEVGTELHCTLVLRPSFIRWHCGIHFSQYSFCSRDYKLSYSRNLYPSTRPVLCSCFVLSQPPTFWYHCTQLDVPTTSFPRRCYH